MVRTSSLRILSGKLALLFTLTLTDIFMMASARDYFNPALLELDNQKMTGADLSSFEEGEQAPGKYRVDVIINDQMVDTRDIDFFAKKDRNGEQKLEPCLPVALLKSYGVNVSTFPDIETATGCANLAAIPQASSEFLFNIQKLVLNIPQAAIAQQIRGFVPPELWDEGITAAMLNYSVNGASIRARADGENSHSQYANLRSGINIGPWRLRNYTTWSRDSEGADKWDTVYTYLQRGIAPLKAQLTLGDSSAPADIFDSMPFRGGQLASDDDMTPDSQKGYAPVVRGIARTNAQVVIRQNGYVIYQNFVSPGAFEITDLYPTGGAGDLNVTVKEADGSEQNFTVAFASLPVLQREGQLKYAVTTGQYRSYDNRVDKTSFAQLTGIYGLPFGLTVYGGTQQSRRYQSVAAGLGKNMGDIGALSADVTQAWSTPKNTLSEEGQSWRVRYTKNFVTSGTNFSIAGYRYSTSGYYGMQEVLDSYGNDTALNNRRHNRMELTMSQSLGNERGSLMLSAVRENYWNSPQTMQSMSIGYNNSWKGISYGVMYILSKNSSTGNDYDSDTARTDRQIALNINIPFDRFLRNTWANYSINTSKNNSANHMVGINGVALEGNALSWNIQQGYTTEGTGYTGSLNADYKGTYGEYIAGYGYDKNSEHLNYGVSGGIIAHKEGLTLSQPFGETNVLIKAPGAAGVSVINQNGAKTDFRGYTVVSNVSPYRNNDLGLNTSTLPENTELELTNRTVIPTRGAVVLADYIASVGFRILLTLKQANGQTIPFGAVVNVDGSAGKGFIVGEDGQVYLTGMAQTGNMIVTWGSGAQQQCTVKYDLTNVVQHNGISVTENICQ